MRQFPRSANPPGDSFMSKLEFLPDKVMHDGQTGSWSGRADLNCRPLAPQVEPFSGREQSGSPLAKS